MRRVAIALAVLALAACKRESPPDEGTVDTKPLPPVKPLGPTKANVPTFAVAVTAPPAEHGKPVVATVAVTPTAGYHVNVEYPYTALTFAAAPGITTAHATQSAQQATHYDKSQLAFGVELTCADAGPHKLTGELKFAVCDDNGTGCMPQTAPVEVAVEVR